MNFLFSLLIFVAISDAYGANMHVKNQCQETLWAAATPGGGKQLNSGQEWSFDVPAGTTGGRIWARTGCNFDATGKGNCQTGDCNGVLECKVYGKAPNTLAEYGLNKFMNLDFFDISLVDGFNVKMEFSPTSNNCTKRIVCNADINKECPKPLVVQGGCNNPCTTFKKENYCCNNPATNCVPTDYSKFFKARCKDAYSYPKDDQTSTFTCPGGTNYKVVFCP